MLGSVKPEPAIHLAAFGKHPGWNDHIDDIGLDTADLITVKGLLYLQGINQNIDAGAWEKLDPHQRIDAFRHNLLWHMPAGDHASLIAGRLWSSVDGKGRDKYPMVLCANSVDLPDSFTGSTVLPYLSRIHERCAAATDAASVQKIIENDRAKLRARIDPVPALVAFNPLDIVKVADCSDFAPAREGFHRIVYQIARGMSQFRPGPQHNPTARAEKIRVPLCGLSTPDALLFWLRFTLTLLDPASPILLLAPDPAITQGNHAPTESSPDAAPEQPVSPTSTSNGWLDIIVGPPTAADLFCIKASPKSLPLTSDIPYTLDPSFTAAINHFINDCKSTPAGSLLPAWPQL